MPLSLLEAMAAAPGPAEPQPAEPEPRAASFGQRAATFDEEYPPGTIPASELEHCAVIGDLRGVIAALAAGGDVNARAADGYTALHGAAENGRLEVVRLLAQRGADLDAKAASGETPLTLARAAGQHDAAALLLSLGARPDEPGAAPQRGGTELGEAQQFAIRPGR
jgi:hypothetical protein